MFVPEGYLPLGGAVEYVARIREPEAVAELTPDGFAFFSRLDAAMLPRVAPPAAPIRSIRAGALPGTVRPAEPEPAAAAATPSTEAETEALARVKQWSAARQKLTAARDNAQADLRRALISGTIRAAAIGEDGNLVTIQPARWRVTFGRSRVAGLEPFAEALKGNIVPVTATAGGIPAAWGRAIIARADLARWCGGPPEAEPAERPRDWPGPGFAPQSVPPAGAWWTAEQALAWVAFGRAERWEDAREGANVPDSEEALDRLRAAQLRISEAIADRKLPAWGQETAEIAKPPLCDTLTPIPPEDFAGPSALTVQLNGWAYPPKLGRRYEGRWWQGMRFEAAAVQAAFAVGPAPAVPSPPEPAKLAARLPARSPPGQVYSTDALAAWFLLRVKTWPKGELPPSEADCVAAAQSYFADAPGRDAIREIRQKKTPKDWRKRGPRPRR